MSEGLDRRALGIAALAVVVTVGGAAAARTITHPTRIDAPVADAYVVPAPTTAPVEPQIIYVRPQEPKVITVTQAEPPAPAPVIRVTVPTTGGDDEAGEVEGEGE